MYAVVYLKPKQLTIKDCARRFVLKLYRHEASRGLFATAEILVSNQAASPINIKHKGQRTDRNTQNTQNIYKKFSKNKIKYRPSMKRGNKIE